LYITRGFRKAVCSSNATLDIKTTAATREIFLKNMNKFAGVNINLYISINTQLVSEKILNYRRLNKSIDLVLKNQKDSLNFSFRALA
jgi:hypothetical protein